MKKLACLFLLPLTISCGKPGSSATIDSNENLPGLNDPIMSSKGFIVPQIVIQASYEMSDVLPQVQNAINTWNIAIGKVLITLDTSTLLTQTGNSFQNCSTSYLFAASTLCFISNGLFYDRLLPSDVGKPQSEVTSGWAYNTHLDTSVIAVTSTDYVGFISNNPDVNLITKASIRYNRDTFVLGDTTQNQGPTQEDGVFKQMADMESISLHELGHLLGLGHTVNNSENIMYPTMSVGPNATKRTLSTCDINRVQHIYNGIDLLSECE